MAAEEEDRVGRWESIVAGAAEATLRELEEGLAQHPALLQQLRAVTIAIVEEAPEDDPHLLGSYLGYPLSEGEAIGVLPPLVELYLLPLVDMSTPVELEMLEPDEEELARQARITVLHELGHHLGLDHDRLHLLGLE